MSKGKKQSKLHVVEGDMVVVISGNDKGKTGKVDRVLIDQRKAVVISEDSADDKRINIITKHVKPSAQNPKGGIVKTESPVLVSKLMVIPKGEDIPSRLGRKKDKEGKLVRFSRKTNKILK
jgi:large subunit ribosomal protein L24